MSKMAMRISKDRYYCNIAAAVAARSTCLRRHYGAVIVKNDQIISTGFNGAPRGETNCSDTGTCIRNENNCEKGSGYLFCPAVHAEQNAIIHASREQMIDSTIYVVGFEVEKKSDNPLAPAVHADPRPCALCRRQMINAGIKRVVGIDPDRNIVEYNIHNSDVEVARIVEEDLITDLNQELSYQMTQGYDKETVTRYMNWYIEHYFK